MRALVKAGAMLVLSSVVVMTMTGEAAAQAGFPMCDEVVDDPTIATCTCVCEASAQFSGCQGKSAGEAAPTPGQCPDMLQGRRVLSRGDWLIAADPAGSSTTTETRTLYFSPENAAANPGLGEFTGTPAFTLHETVQCTGNAGETFPMQTRFARLFDLPYDMAVTVRPVVSGSAANCNSPGAAPNLVIHVNSHNAGAPSVPELENTLNSQWMQLAIDDFDYDGFDDILFLNIDSIQMFTAVDPSDPSQGLVHTSGVKTTQASGAFPAPLNEPTTGDFNGDGLIDVAWIGGDFPHHSGMLSVFFATICPGDVSGTLCAGALPFEVILDPAQLLAGDGTSTIVLPDAPLTSTACGVVQSPHTASAQHGSLRAGTVVLGNFEDNGFNPRGAPIDELVVAYVSGSDAIQGDLCLTNVQYWSFSPPTSSSPAWAVQRGLTVADIFPAVKERTTINGVQYQPTINLYSQAAYLDWYGPVEQAVIGLSGVGFTEDCAEESCVGIRSHWYPVTVSVAGTGSGAQAQVCTALAPSGGGDREGPFIWGLAVGRFSTSTTVAPGNPSACGDFFGALPGECPYNPQIAMLLAGNTGNTAKPTSLRLYTVESSDACDFLPQHEATIDVSGFTVLDVAELRAGGRLRAADVAGNSVRVGTPTVTRIGAHSQPQVVIQAPPSLVDYVNPTSSASGEPAIVNFSRSPGQFNAEFDFASTSTDSASTSQTASHTGSFAETVSGKVKVGVPLAEELTVKNTESWKQYHDHTTTNQLSDYFSTGLKTGGEVGADDMVSWTQTTFNVFHFPVIGETVCPATVACDASDPNTLGCTEEADGVELVCETSDDGCACASESATASLCPATPGEIDVRLSCSTNGGDVCCAQRPQQLQLSISGPEEASKPTSAPGSLLEWYQPKHEPGQILSYPSTTTLLRARTPGFQSLAVFNDFITGTNSSFETFSWQCGSSQGNSIGTTTRHSFESDTSVTVGTNELAKQTAGFEASAEFDYQTSTSLATLNTHVVGQSTASSVTLNLEPEAFYQTSQYAYTLQGELFGVDLPGVLDDPDITVGGDPPGCTTSGPLTVAFAADPVSSNPGQWWRSNPPYAQYTDVALNNPSRWKRAEAGSVADSGLQCRGPSNGLACYTITRPATDTTASNVWGADFYDMKGLFVTTGALGGPQRTTARVGDEVFLQLRVYNYSLIGTADRFPGGRVRARIYRQQLDVNEIGETLSVTRYATDAAGQPLPAVPVGPAGLGDSTPITVLDPVGATNVYGFNTSTDARFDNISLATTSYLVPEGDACDETSCDGAYYAYWATVWAEDASGNVVGELPGHGLRAQFPGAFDPDASYAFITDVPLEVVSFDGSPTTFSNNAGMHKQVFAIVPAETGTLLDATGPGTPRVDRLLVSARKTSVGSPVVVSAEIASLGAPTPGATVIFSDGDPDDGGTVFDVETVAHIRANDVHVVQVSYTPTTCGKKRLFADITARGVAERESVSLSVPCKPHKVQICHKGQKELSVPAPALRVHLRHGDELGACRDRARKGSPWRKEDAKKHSKAQWEK